MSFWINVVFLLVIHSSLCAHYRHPFITRVILSWMEVYFLSQQPYIPNGLLFSSLIRVSVVLSKSMCISAFGPSSSPFNSLVILFINRSFSLWFFSCYIIVWNCSISLASYCWYVFVSSPSFDKISFRCSWISCFVYIDLPFADTSIIFLFSPGLSGLFP